MRASAFILMSAWCLLGQGACAAPPAGRPPGARAVDICQAAVVALPDREATAVNNFYSPAPPDQVFGDLKRLATTALGEGWAGQAPTAITARDLDAAASQSALICDNVTALATARGSVVPENEGRARMAAMRLSDGVTVFHRVSLPVLDKARKEGIITVLTGSNRLAGGSYLLLLRKVDGQWKIVGRKTLTMS